jgi:cell division protein FtsA
MPAKPQFAVGLDAGSSATRCVISLFEDGRLRFLGHGEIESIGWSKGRIGDSQALSTCIQAAVQQAEIEAQASVEGMVIGIGGSGIEGANTRGVYEFGRPHEVTADDMAYAVERTSRVRLEEDRCLLHVFPQDFTLDGRSGYRYPRGSTCSRLEANVHIVTASLQEHSSVLNAAHQAHFAVEETVFEPVAAAYSSVMTDDRNRGLALIDIGAHSTDMVVYDGDALLLAKSLPVSAGHFTRDVAFGLKVLYEDAERLKVEYGCAMLGLTSDNSLIEVPSAEGRAPREAPRRQLNEILEARAEELYYYAGCELVRIGMDQKLLEGIVLTGGGAMLNGMCDMAERVLNCPARNGLPVGIDHWPEELDNPLWTTVAGLSMYSAKVKSKKEWKPKAPGLVNLLLR